MKRLLAVLLAFFCVASGAQSINGVPNQVMSGFAPSVGGVPILATVSNYLGNTAAITSQIECTAANCPAGEYLILVSLTPTSTATLGTITLTLNFTDSGQAQTVTAINALGLTTKVSASTMYSFWSTGTTNISWSTSVATVTGSYAYDVHVRLFRLS